MYSNKTIRKYVRRANAVFAFLSTEKTENIRFCVSYGNKKIGKVLNVSKAPIFTCKGLCKGCAGFCYDVKACLQYGNVLEARIRNTVIFLRDRDDFFKRIRQAMNARKKDFFLRYDVGGEIVDSDEVSRIVKLAIDYSHFIVWTYTKNHKAVNDFVKANSATWKQIENGTLPGTRENMEKCRLETVPKNLVIMFSRVDANEIDNPFFFPEFNVVTNENGKKIDAPYCNGNCTECRKNHMGCTNGESRNVAEH